MLLRTGIFALQAQADEDDDLGQLYTHFCDVLRSNAGHLIIIATSTV